MASTSAALKLLAQENTLSELFVRGEDERPKVAHNAFRDDIPVISLAGIDVSAERRSEIREKIAEASEEWGLFQVIDHGIDPDLISKMTRLSQDFFSLPDDEKLRFDMSGGKKGGFIISSHLQGEAVMHWRELVTFFSYPIGARDYSRWPDKPEGWKAVTEAYSENVIGLARKILELLSEAMGLEKDAIAKACLEMDQKIVVNFYPKCPQPDLTLGIKKHTDPDTITVLVQDQVGGLQVTKDGGKTWITVRPVKGALVVNIGDHVHYLSNGRFKSALHRAVVNSDSSRLSIATFQNPAPEAIVYPLINSNIREGEEKPLLEEPITFAEMYKRIFRRGLKLGEGKPQNQTELDLTDIIA
ncbi:OLC1v1018232C1 [Oldenlandia corymbosa var. corymbosa]|uniref:OLC1v1018232C1 n=1 Tax=Oldenlandia corymbosa var. corymbosa TaxID=529605 RepID=A0AAV1EBC7_OLDCO|nr:OLC1v1018232C1 [Oldenlandia corymbosa var. corymbosa]